MLGPIKISNGKDFAEKTVEPEKSMDGGIVSVRSLDIDPFEKIPKERKRPNDEFYHKIKATYRIKPPPLPAGVEQITDEDSSLPLYKLRKQRFIVANDEDELRIAIQLKTQRYPNAFIVCSDMSDS